MSPSVPAPGARTPPEDSTTPDGAAAAGSVRGVIVATVLAAVVAVAFVSVYLPGPTTLVVEPPWEAPAFLVFALAILWLQRTGFVFHWRGHRSKTSFDEIAIYVGLLLLSPWAFLLGVATAVAANQLLSHRGALKTTFNVGEQTLAAALAAVAYWGLVVLGAHPLVAAAAGPLVYSVATHLLVGALFSRLEQQPFIAVLRQRFTTWGVVMSTVLGTSVGFVTALLYLFHPAAVVAVLPILWSIWRFGQLSEWNLEEIEVHHRLGHLDTSLAGKADLDEVADQVLATCREIFDCGEATLALDAAEAGHARVWSRSFEGGSLGAGGIATPVLGDGGSRPLGRLSIFPLKGGRAFGERELALLESVAAAVATATVSVDALGLVQAKNAELRRSERRYRDLFESANVFIHVTDERGVILEANEAELSALGYDRGEVVGRHVTAIYDNLDPEDFASNQRRLAASGELVGSERVMRARDGSRIHVLVDVKPRFDEDGSFLHHVAFARDVTPLKRLEEDLRRANVEQAETIRRIENLHSELEEFTLWTTHDMREPLRSVATLARALHDDVDVLTQDEIAEGTLRIHRAADQLKERIKALHSFSQVVQRDESFEDVPLADLYGKALAAQARESEERHVEIRGGVPASAVVRAQPGKLELAISAVLENAIRYNDHPEPRVDVACVDTGAAWEIKVSDNGPGIPQEYRSRVFHLFQRGPNVTGAPGAGAGLALARRVLEHHGGDVELETRVGRGSTFRIRVPKIPAGTVAALRGGLEPALRNRN